MVSGFDLEFIFKCFFEGVLFAQVAYVILHLCVHHKRQDYRYYLLYLLSSSAYFLYKDVMYYELGWKYGGYPYPHNGLNYILANLMHLAYLEFVKHFVGSKALYPRIHSVAVALTGFISFFILLNAGSLVLFKTLVPAPVQYAYSGIVAVVTLALLVRMVRRRNRLLNYIIYGSVVYAISSVLSLVVAVAHMQGYLTAFESSLTIVQVGVMLEVLCFTAGLAYKAVLVEQERNTAQQRLLQQMEENRELDEELQHVRDKIAQDLHDDVGATLTAISVYSEVAHKYQKRGNTDRVLDMLDQIGVSARQMVQDMHDIIWMINPKSDEMSALFDKLHLFASAIAEGKGITLSFRIEQEIKALQLNMQLRRDVYLLVKESVHNAVKHSACQTLWVTCAQEGEFLYFAIKDDGKGFPPQGTGRGNGMANMTKRARQHQGKVEVVSNGTGSTVTFRFKVQHALAGKKT